MLCKLVGTLKVLASSTCSNYSTVFNLISTHTYQNCGHSYTVECLFGYYRYLKLRPSVCQPTCKALYSSRAIPEVLILVMDDQDLWNYTPNKKMGNCKECS